MDQCDIESANRRPIALDLQRDDDFARVCARPNRNRRALQSRDSKEALTVARIPYPDPSRYEHEPLAERIKRERGGNVLNLYKMLLHSPPVAEGWLAFFTSIRQNAALQGRYRELAILRVAVLNGASYEFEIHVPFALKEGCAAALVDALRAERVPDALDRADRAVIAYADSMTREIHVPDDVFAQVREHFDERQIVELTATIAGYNCVSRFLEALRVDGE
jgi:alkylhydroperoxidase family enzyme